MLRTSRFASRLIPRSSARFFSTKPPTDTASTASTAASAEVVIEHTSPSPLDETDGKVSSLLELQMSLRAALSTSDFSAATTLSDQIIAQTSTLFPPTDPHPALARAYNDNGYVHKAVGSHHLAIESYHKAIQLYRDSVGPTSSGYAQALGNVSVCYREYASVLGKEEGESEVESEKMESGLLARSKEAAESAVNASEAHINKIEAAMEEYKNDPDPGEEQSECQVKASRAQRRTPSSEALFVHTCVRHALSFHTCVRHALSSLFTHVYGLFTHVHGRARDGKVSVY